MTVQVEAHTDNTGDPNSNKKLDQAEAIKNMLVAGGIDGPRIVPRAGDKKADREQ